MMPDISDPTIGINFFEFWLQWPTGIAWLLMLLVVCFVVYRTIRLISIRYSGDWKGYYTIKVYPKFYQPKQEKK